MIDSNKKRRTIEKIYERDMDLVLVEELESSNEFRIWLAARVFGYDCYVSHERAEHSVTDESRRESDVVFRFNAQLDGMGEPAKAAILIENKIDAVEQPNQGTDYRKRGEAAKEREGWKDFRTCLVAPQKYLETASDAYDENISYEEILAYFASRKQHDERFRWKAQLVNFAIEKKESGYTAPPPSETATAFVRAYYKEAQAFPRLQMQEPKPRPAGNTWITFQPDFLPKRPYRVTIEHQLLSGAVKLMMYGAADKFDDIKEQLNRSLSPQMEIEPAGKSVAVAIKVPPLKFLETPFEKVKPDALEAMKAADELAQLAETTKLKSLLG